MVRSCSCLAYVYCTYLHLCYVYSPLAHISYFKWLGNLKYPLNQAFRVRLKVCNFSISYGIALAKDTSRYYNICSSNVLLALLEKENK